MGLGSWAKKHLGIRLDSHTLGNLVKNVAPAAAFTPLGVVGAGALGAVGERLRGKTDLADLAKAGFSNAAIGGGLHAGVGALERLGQGGAESAVSGAPSLSAATDTVPTGSLPGVSIPDLTTSAVKAVDPRGFGGKLLDAGKGIARFAGEHPNATSGALQAVGNLATAGGQNRLARDQSRLLEQQAQESDYDFAQRKARDLAYAPLWSALGTGLGDSYNGVAKNPYTSTGG